MTNEEAINILKTTRLYLGRVSGKMIYAEALNMAIEALKAQSEIIPCRDCKHRGEMPINDGRYWCDIHNSFMYYCSDAERR